MNPYELLEGDYKLVEGGAWFEIKQFAIRVHATDSGVDITVYQAGREMDDPITETFAADNMIHPEVDEREQSANVNDQ